VFFAIFGCGALI